MRASAALRWIDASSREYTLRLLRARHREINKRFLGTVSLAVVMSQDFGHLGQTIAAAPLDFLGDL